MMSVFNFIWRVFKQISAQSLILPSISISILVLLVLVLEVGRSAQAGWGASTRPSPKAS